MAEYKPNYTPSSSKKDHFKGYKQGKGSKGGYMHNQEMDQMQMNEFVPNNVIPPGSFNQMSSKKRDKKAIEKINETPKVNVNLSPIKIQEICKFYKTGSCSKGDDCPFSHNLNNHPCKFIHSTGTCKYGDNCEFSHRRLEHHEIPIFIKENEDFLDQIYEETKTTNLGAYYIQFKIDQENKRKEQHRDEYAAKLHSTLLPDEIKRDLVANDIDSRFQSRIQEQPVVESMRHSNQQIFDNYNGMNRAPMNSGMQRRPDQVQDNRMQGMNQMNDMNPRNNQMMSNNQQQMGRQMNQPMAAQINQQMKSQMPVVSGPNSHLQKVNMNGHIIQDSPQRQRNFNTNGNNLAPNESNVQRYNSSNGPQSNVISSQSRQYLMTVSPARNDDMQSMNPRMPQNTGGNHYNQRGGSSNYTKQYQNNNQHMYLADKSSDNSEFFTK